MSSNKLKTHELNELISLWDKKLESEGFETIQNNSRISPQIYNPYSKQYIVQIENLDDLSLTPRNKEILQLHNEGKSLRYIEKQLKAKYEVTESISYIQIRRIINKYLKLQADKSNAI